MIAIYEGKHIAEFLKRLEVRREETSREVRNAVQDILRLRAQARRRGADPVHA